MRRVQRAFQEAEPIFGFQVDDACRDYIKDQGYEERFVPSYRSLHWARSAWNGANMDNLEVHDDRKIIPWTCFSIEPGIYFENFGVRSEVNIFIDDRTARVTGELQRELVKIL